MVCCVVFHSLIPLFQLAVVAQSTSPLAREYGNLLDAEAAQTLDKIETLLRNYSLTMDTSAEKDGHDLLLSEFHNCLMQLSHSSSDMVYSDALANHVIVSVYTTRAHTMKHMLSSNYSMTLRWDELEMMSTWTTDLLVEFLKFKASTMNLYEYKILGSYGKVGVANDRFSNSTKLSPIELAVKLGMSDVLKLLVQYGEQVCLSFEPFQCRDVLHYATVNQDKTTIAYLLELISSEMETSKVPNQNIHLCRLLTHSDKFERSPLDIAHYQCSSGLDCSTYEFISEQTHLLCVEDYNPQSYSYGYPTCALKHGLVLPSPAMSPKSEWFRCIDEGTCTSGAWSGHWSVYKEHRVGKRGCDLATISNIVSPQEFERNFVNLRLEKK